TLALMGASFSLTGCGDVKGEAKYPTSVNRELGGDNNIYEKPDSIFGDGGLLGGGKKKDDVGASAVGVNGFLWRAALDTVSFIPLASADPFGGVILTEWYTDPETPNERLKLNVFIMGRELKSDGVKVKAFRQVKSGSGWVDAKVAEDTTRKLEDAILTRARQLRVAHLGETD
ncbi:MAG: DUF3576 domain-containing protein, partial [Verrucomicrobia bacterium]|nr:DUF3576 domain-containing protein [Verrucomicrobiota bacterium]